MFLSALIMPKEERKKEFKNRWDYILEKETYLGNGRTGLGLPEIRPRSSRTAGPEQPPSQTWRWSGRNIGPQSATTGGRMAFFFLSTEK